MLYADCFTAAQPAPSSKVTNNSYVGISADPPIQMNRSGHLFEITPFLAIIAKDFIIVIMMIMKSSLSTAQPQSVTQ